MNSLMNYGSDDNSDDSGDNRFPEMPRQNTNPPAPKNQKKGPIHEDNYEEVGMDMSENQINLEQSLNRRLSETVFLQDSNDSDKPQQPSTSRPEKSTNQRIGHTRERNSRSGSRSPKYKKDDDRRNGRHTRDDRRDRRRDDRDRDVDRGRKEDDKGRDKYRDDRRDRDRRDDRYGRDRRDRRRSRSRDRRRSSRSPRRSRSGSRERAPKHFPNRRDKADKRMDRLGKLGIEFKPDTYPASAIDEAERSEKGGDRFFMPGITGRFRDQIEKRKLLWQKAKEPEIAAPSTSVNVTQPLGGAAGSKSTKVYEATQFADDRTSNKFKRLMGIKETPDTSTLPVKSTDVLKKQQEMFTSMEAQYEVARTATHTMRGVGLGFGSFQR